MVVIQKLAGLNPAKCPSIYVDHSADLFILSRYVSFIGLRLTKTSLTHLNSYVENSTRLRTKGQSAGYPQAQIEITSNSFQRRAP